MPLPSRPPRGERSQHQQDGTGKLGCLGGSSLVWLQAVSQSTEDSNHDECPEASSPFGSRV